MGSQVFGSGSKLRHWQDCGTAAMQCVLLSCDEAGGLSFKIQSKAFQDSLNCFRGPGASYDGAGCKLRE